MTDLDLTEQLEHAGARTPVGPPPLGAIRRNVARRRRRRGWAVSAVCVAGVATIAVGATLLGPDRLGADVAGPDAPPPGTRFVGLGDVTIAVPQTWGTDDTGCGLPQAETVVIADGHFDYMSSSMTCFVPHQPTVDNVHVGQGLPEGFEPDETIEIDGRPADRTTATCSTDIEPYVGRQYCSATVRFPQEDVWFRVNSPSGVEEVDRMLDTITVLPDLVGVPFYRDIYRDVPDADQAYAARLTEAGLKVKIVESDERVVPKPLPGFILRVSPERGTMLPPGSTVTVTVSTAGD